MKSKHHFKMEYVKRLHVVSQASVPLWGIGGDFNFLLSSAASTSHPREGGSYRASPTGRCLPLYAPSAIPCQSHSSSRTQNACFLVYGDFEWGRTQCLVDTFVQQKRNKIYQSDVKMVMNLTRLFYYIKVWSIDLA